jgi:hypothetical protein
LFAVGAINDKSNFSKDDIMLGPPSRLLFTMYCVLFVPVSNSDPASEARVPHGMLPPARVPAFCPELADPDPDPDTKFLATEL